MLFSSAGWGADCWQLVVSAMLTDWQWYWLMSISSTCFFFCFFYKYVFHLDCWSSLLLWITSSKGAYVSPLSVCLLLGLCVCFEACLQNTTEHISMKLGWKDAIWIREHPVQFGADLDQGMDLGIIFTFCHRGFLSIFTEIYSCTKRIIEFKGTVRHLWRHVFYWVPFLLVLLSLLRLSLHLLCKYCCKYCLPSMKVLE